MPEQRTDPLLSSTQAALDAGVALAKLQNIVPDGLVAPCAVIPEGYKLCIPDRESIEEHLDHPLRKHGRFTFGDPDSFCRYFNEHKNSDSRIFAYATDHAARVTGVLNFHGEMPSFNDHECVLETRATKEWTVWTGNNKKPMTQIEFAQFLEDNADMFTEPTGAALLELVQTLEGKSHVDFNSGVKLQTRAIQLSYTEVVELKGGAGSEKGQLTLPPLLTVGIAPFEGTPRYKMCARLRYRIDDRKVKFWYEMVDAHLVVREVVSNILLNIEKSTGVVPFRT